MPISTILIPLAMAATFRNPLKAQGADPFLTYHEGWYYLATTTAVDVKMRKARRLGELKDAADVVVWKGEGDGLKHLDRLPRQTRHEGFLRGPHDEGPEVHLATGRHPRFRSAAAFR